MKILDLYQLSVRVNYKEDIVKELMKYFSENYSMSYETIKSLITLGSKEQSLKMIHNLKGITANLSMEILNSTTTELENSLLSGDEEKFHRLLDRFNYELDEVLEYIGKLI